MVEFKGGRSRIHLQSNLSPLKIVKANTTPASLSRAMIAMAKMHFSAFSNHNLIANHAYEGARFEGPCKVIHETLHKFIDLQNENI